MKLRFTLRSLAISVLLFAVTIGWWGNWVRSQRAVVAEINQLGGCVLNVYPGHSLFQAPVYPAWLPEALRQVYPMNFNYIHLADLENVDDQNIERILSISGIYGIDLSASRVTDRTLQRLQQHGSLRELVLRDVKNVSSSGIAEFKRLSPECEVLGL